MLAFTKILGVLVEEIARLAPSATVVYVVQSSEKATVEPVAVVSTSKYWYSFVALYIPSTSVGLNALSKIRSCQKLPGARFAVQQ